MDPFSFAVMTVAQIGIGYLFPSEGPRMKDLKIAASTYGAPIPEAFGVVRLAANMIWSDQIKEHKKRKRVALKSVKYYTYTCTFAMAVCQGPVASVRKIWANHKLIYDAENKRPLAINKKFNFRMFLGDEDQMPSEAISKIVGEANTPAYRGLCYVLFEDLPLEDFGNSIPQITVEVFAQGEATGIGRAERITKRPGSGTGFSDAVVSFDHDIGYGFLSVNSTFDTLVRFSISGRAEDLRTPAGSEIRSLLGVSPTTGHLIAQDGASNSSKITLIDKWSLTALDTLGFNGNTFDFPYAKNKAVFTVHQGQEYCAYLELFGDYKVFQTAPLVAFGAGYATMGRQQYGVYGNSFIVGGHNMAFPTFFAWDGDSATTITGVAEMRLWKMEYIGLVWVRTLLWTYVNPDGGGEQNSVNFRVQGLHYDALDGGLLLVWLERNSQVWCAKWDPNTKELRWRKQLTLAGFEAQYIEPAILTSGVFSYCSDSRVVRVNTMTGDWEVTGRTAYQDFSNPDDLKLDDLLPMNKPYSGDLIVEDPADFNFSSTSIAYLDSRTGRLVYAANSASAVAYLVTPSLQPADKLTLGSLVERLLRRAGMTSAQFDVSSLHRQTIRGYGWASQSDLKGILDQLRMLYLFDMVERDGKLVGVMRADGLAEAAVGEITPAGARPVRRITGKLLGSNGSGEGMDYWQETRLQEAELPARVTLSYMNVDRDFETSTAITRRIADPIPTMFTRQQVAMEIGVVMTPTEAKNQVNKILWTQWSERVRHNTRVPWTYLDLDPADLVQVSLTDGRLYQDRLHRLEFGADLGIEIESYAQSPEAYVSEVPADGGSGGPPVPVTNSRQALPFILNTPLLRDGDDTGGGYSLYYTAIGHSSPVTFDGAALWRSPDGQAFDLLYATDQDVEWAVVGSLVPPPRHGAHGLDWETRIKLWPSVNWFEIESVTDDELWNGANLCVIGSEVIQFRDCVENVDGSWTIWNLLRGRRGTEYAVGTHRLGESFVCLSPTTITGEGETLDAGGLNRTFIAVGDGTYMEDATEVTIRYAPRDLMPYAPKDIRRSVSGSNVTLDWKRRTRMGGNMIDGTETVPLHETSEQYEVYVLSEPYAGDLSRGDEVPRDLILHEATTSASSLTFSTSGFQVTKRGPDGVTEILAPFDVNLDTLHVLIYQVSSAVGRGFPGVRSIEPWQDF